ncbi:MAG TPA: putative sulfate/molybdate transporter [Usitatibacteraceae bacterium]|nr:putative sulfate/molybdate transporter [Usitatibacteraceae bacterium]
MKVEHPSPAAAGARNRYDLKEFSGAFGDLGTLVPFVIAYLAIVKMDAGGVLLGFGGAMIATGLWYRTPVPVQPMKAIGAAAATHAAGAAITPSIVVGSGLVTALIWVVLGATGLAKKLAEWIPRPALLGVVLGLGFSFMLEGIRMMSGSAWLAAALLAFALLAHSRLPTMLLLLAAGVVIALVRQPALAAEISAITPAFRWPAFAWPALSAGDLWAGAVLLALPQLPLTFGNALLAITSENNRLFPDRPVTERGIAISTGLANAWSSAMGGVPVCHGAGGMAGHVKFGARTGGSTVMLGVLLALLALFFSDSVHVLLRLFPEPVLGVILFLAGAELALSSREAGDERVGRFVLLTTAAFTVVHVGVAVIFGILAYHASKRGWLRP